MNERYPRSFSPIKLGPVDISNRIYFSPHGSLMSERMSDEWLWYCLERAEDGLGLIIQSTYLSPAVRPGVRSLYSEKSIPAFARAADMLHEYDTKIFAEVFYSPLMPGTWEYSAPQRPTLGPSTAQQFDRFAVGREMSRADIKAMHETFARCAANARTAGYDGFELHCTHGMLHEQFLSPYWNRREDEYGGSDENRLRFVREALEVIRQAAGPEMAVGVRYNCDEMLPGGLNQEAAGIALATIASEGLVDFVDLDVTVEPHQFPLGMPNYQLPKFTYEGYVDAVGKRVDSVPVLSCLGRVTSIADAESALERGSADMIGMARGLIAEPHLVKHAREGKESRSRTCIACNYCMDHSSGIGDLFGCAINPATSREGRWGVRTTTPAPASKKVVVVGGGPAGLEAARVAAVRGHEVVLFERDERLGGQYKAWSSLPGREGLFDAIEWYVTELPEVGVDIRTGTAASVESVLAESPDSVLVGTGSSYVRNGASGFMPAPLPGWDRPFVYTPDQIVEEGARPSGNVLILDDEALNTGIGVAEILAGAGAKVEFVTRWLHVAHNQFFTFELPLMIATLKNLDVRLTPQTYMKEIGDHEVTLFDVFTNVETKRTGIDAVVLSTMRAPRADLHAALEGKVDQLFVIGDAAGVRDHGAAFYEGSYFARMIGEPNAPKTFSEAFQGAFLERPEQMPIPAAGTPAIA